MNKKNVGLIAILVLFISVGYVIHETDMSESLSTQQVSTEHTPGMRGLCWVAGDSIADHNMAQINAVGANWISQTPFGWMTGYQSTEVVLSNDRAWWGETDRGIAHTVEHAKVAGIKTMLKPHIWLRRSGDKWRSDIEMQNKTDWDTWFESYTNWILHYASLAEEHNVESLCIGTELHQTIKHTEQWRTIIKEIRKIYNGDLIYAANWYQEFEDVKFWDDLDYIGIQGYFPLSNKEYPKKKDLVNSWTNHKKKLARIADKYNKNVVFTEIGYKNTADAAIEPWTWPQDLNHQEITVSDETQRICYEALFESLWHEQWFEGLFIWKWFHSTHAYEDFDSYFLAWDKRRKNRAIKHGRDYKNTVHFSPQRTSTLEILSGWYTDNKEKT